MLKGWGGRLKHDQFLPSPSLPPSGRLLPLLVEGTLKGDVLLHGGI